MLYNGLNQKSSFNLSSASAWCGCNSLLKWSKGYKVKLNTSWISRNLSRISLLQVCAYIYPPIYWLFIFVTIKSAPNEGISVSATRYHPSTAPDNAREPGLNRTLRYLTSIFQFQTLSIVSRLMVISAWLLTLLFTLPQAIIFR